MLEPPMADIVIVNILTLKQNFPQRFETLKSFDQFRWENYQISRFRPSSSIRFPNKNIYTRGGDTLVQVPRDFTEFETLFIRCRSMVHWLYICRNALKEAFIHG